MVDSRKIDDYFANNRLLPRRPLPDKLRASRWIRFVKLGFPCVAAVLCGVMVVVPNIRKSVELNSGVTMPKKSEMEKLHMEATVFSATDSQNRINRITADSVDELEPGSAKVKIINPHGEIPTDSGMVLINAPTGYFDQDNSVLDLENTVQAVVDDDTKITTAHLTYDFREDVGSGNTKISAVGSWGTLIGDAFEYQKKDALLILRGHSAISTSSGTLTAEKTNHYYQNEEKIVSVGDVTVVQQKNTLKADKMVSYLSSGQPKEIKKIEAFGHVQIITPKERATAVEAVYDAASGKAELYGASRADGNKKGIVTVKQGENTLQAQNMVVWFTQNAAREVKLVEAIGKVQIISPKGTASGDRGYYKPQQNLVELVGNVHVITPKGTAHGDKAYYKPQENLVELWDNVLIEQDGNFIRGGRAETNLETSVSRITGREPGERISGTFYRKRKVKDGHETK